MSQQNRTGTASRVASRGPAAPPPGTNIERVLKALERCLDPEADTYDLGEVAAAAGLPKGPAADALKAARRLGFTTAISGRGRKTAGQGLNDRRLEAVLGRLRAQDRAARRPDAEPGADAPPTVEAAVGRYRRQWKKGQNPLAQVRPPADPATVAPTPAAAGRPGCAPPPSTCCGRWTAAGC